MFADSIFCYEMMSPLSPRQTLWLWAAVVSVILSLTAFAVTTKTCTGNICTPYITAANGGVACLSKNPINLRFLLQMAHENDYTANGVLEDKATYAFQPCVDSISALSLKGGPFLAAGYAVTSGTTTSYYFTKNKSDKYLSVYGFGMSNQTTVPEPGISTGAVLIAKNGADACNDASMMGVVTVLSLEIGMHKGFFNYIGQSGQTTKTVANPHYNATLCGESSSGSSHTTTTTTTTTTTKANADASSSEGIDYCAKTITVVVPANNVQPARAGFVPTCDAKDVCLMGSNDTYTCIGNVTGKKNCGICTNNATALAGNAALTVWVSYIGTDRKGNVMTSSGDSPFNYLNYVRNQAFETVTSKFQSLIHVNFSDLGLTNPL